MDVGTYMGLLIGALTVFVTVLGILSSRLFNHESRISSQTQSIADLERRMIDNELWRDKMMDSQVRQTKLLQEINESITRIKDER